MQFKGEIITFFLTIFILLGVSSIITAEEGNLEAPIMYFTDLDFYLENGEVYTAGMSDDEVLEIINKGKQRLDFVDMLFLFRYSDEDALAVAFGTERGKALTMEATPGEYHAAENLWRIVQEDMIDEGNVVSADSPEAGRLGAFEVSGNVRYNVVYCPDDPDPCGAPAAGECGTCTTSGSTCCVERDGPGGGINCEWTCNCPTPTTCAYGEARTCGAGGCDGDECALGLSYTQSSAYLDATS